MERIYISSSQSVIAIDESGHFYISFGADKVEEKDIVSADLVLNNVTYTFFFNDGSDCSDEMLIQMASELAGAARA